MPLSQDRLDRALDQLLALVQQTDGVRAELDHTFESFRAAGEPGDTDQALAGRRAVEWFLLERHSSALQGVPLELALHGGVGLEEELPDDEVLHALVSSFCGVFEVTDVRPGEGVWVRDLLAYGEHPLAEPEGSHALEPGDVLVGRLFPVGDGLHRISHAAGVFRNEGLAEALRSDLERAREGRRGVVRLSQAELETMFWRGVPESASDAELIGRARDLLTEAGLDADDVEVVFQRLAETPCPGEPGVLGSGDPVAEVLDALAFETDVDLESARRALFEVWPVLARPREAAPSPNGAPSKAPPAARSTDGEVDVAQAIANFDRGREEGQDLERLFRELERDLEIDGDEDDAEENLAPDFPGVVGAMVEEFLWDTEREEGAEAAQARRCLTRLSAFGAPIGVFEELGGRDLLSFGSVWLPEWGELEGADGARDVLAALRAFCAWAEERHEVPLRQAYEADVASLEQSLPRIAEANRHRSRVDDVTVGDVYVVEDAGAGTVAVRDAAGTRHELAVPPELGAHLRPGDHVRATRQDAAGDARLDVYCCYPPECAALQQRS